MNASPGHWYWISFTKTDGQPRTGNMWIEAIENRRITSVKNGKIEYSDQTILWAWYPYSTRWYPQTIDTRDIKYLVPVDTETEERPNREHPRSEY